MFKNKSTSNIRKFFSPLKKYPKKFSLLLFKLIYMSFSTIFSVNVLKNITDTIVTKDLTGLYHWSFIYAILVIIFVLIQIILRHAGADAFINTKKYLLKKYLVNVSKIENNYYENIGSGTTIHIINSGTLSRTNILVNGLSNFVPAIFNLIFWFFYIASIGTKYLYLFLLFIIISSLFSFHLFPKANQYRKKRKKIWIKIQKLLVKFLQLKFEILQQNKLNKELIEFENEQRSDLIHNKKEINYLTSIRLFPNSIIFISKILIFIFLGKTVIDWKMTIGELIMFTTIIDIVKRNTSSLTEFIINNSLSFIDIEKLWETFDDQSKYYDYSSGKPFLYQKGAITIKHLNFQYQDNNVIFQDFNLTIKGKQTTALVGKSGDGKSTLIKLLAGYLQPTQWKILIDQQNIKEIKLLDYYQHTGYLQQEPAIFDGTIRENLTYSSQKNISPAKIKAAIKQANCQFIYDFKDKLETEIGERGIKLSGGQKQRLAIARIFLKNPQIIFLDEPTAALDSFSEEKISTALDNLFQNRTVVIIAHHLQTVKKANSILFLQKGKIVEQGTHQELVKLKGQYKKLLDLQSGF